MKTLTTQQLKEWGKRHERFAFINVLPAEKFESTHIADSIDIPVDQKDFAKQVEKRAKKDEKIVVCCASEQCDASQKAAEQLDAAGFKNVYRYAGGAKAWHEAGEPLHAGA